MVPMIFVARCDSFDEVLIMLLYLINTYVVNKLKIQLIFTFKEITLALLSLTHNILK